MKLGKGHARPTPEGWQAVQQGTKSLPKQIDWPEDQCSRCKVFGPMSFSTGKALCAECAERTVVQTASPVGLHERRRLELQS